MMRKSLQNPAKMGFTLVEAVLSCAIVAAVLVPALQLVVARSASQISQAEQAQAMTLAKQLMTEIMQCHFVDPDGSESGETRATFDDLTDYNGYTQTSLTDHFGATLSSYTRWKTKVMIAHVNPANPSLSGSGTSGLVSIEITVTNPTGTTCLLSGLRSSNDCYDRKPDASATYTSWVDITLESGTGSSATKAVAGVNLLNQVP